MGAHTEAMRPLVYRIKTSSPAAQHIICASCDRPAVYRITRNDGTEGTTACERHEARWITELGRT